MKVAVQTDQLWFSAPGGIGTYVWELVEALAVMQGDDRPALTTFHARFGGEPSRRFTRALDDVEIASSIKALYPSWNLLGRPHLPDTLGSHDVLHATNPASVPPAGDGQALVVTVHDLAFDHFPELFPRDWRLLYRMGARAAIKRADLLLVPSQATRADLVARGADPDHVRVTPLAASLPDGGADPDDVLARLGIPRPFVLSPGTLEPRKNQARLVRAYRRVAPDVPHALVLAGPDGWLIEELDRELGRPGPGTIVRTGRLEPEELDALYRAADLVAYPSRYEGFGLIILEAMARGVPVLTSTTPACAEVAADAAVLVDPLDVEAIADALADLLTDPARRADLAALGTQRAAGFSWAATARATLDAYREATERVHR